MVAFFSEDIDFSVTSPEDLKQWISNVISLEQGQIGVINFIFCSKDYILELNKSYLNHHYYTDVISFDHSNELAEIAGDIFICVEQVKENAKDYGELFDRELKRVMVHGVLHLLGFKDKTTEEQLEMRKKEEAYLSL